MVVKVLVIEDEPQIVTFVTEGFERQGIAADSLPDGVEANQYINTGEYDAVVLDLMMPRRDGLDVLQSLRAEGNFIPVIVLTAKQELDDRVLGLDMGADDYLTKPFFVDELIARVNALVRRARGENLTVLHYGSLSIDLVAREARAGAALLDLTARELDLLAFLMRSPARVRTRMQILEHVWSYNFDPQTNIVDVYIQRLRKKIAEQGQENPFETVRGVGYRMNQLPEVTA